jgi:hypothetical protein
MSWPRYEGLDLFLNRPNWSTGLEAHWISDVHSLQNLGRGAYWFNYDQLLTAFRARYLLADRTSANDLIAFFDDKRGRLYPFWTPSWRAEVTLAAAVGATDDRITVASSDYFAAWGDSGSFGRFLFFWFPDASYACRRVVSAPSPETLRLDQSLGLDVPEEEIGAVLISFLFPVRFDQDVLELHHHAVGRAEAELSFRSVPHEGPSAAVMTTTTTTTTTS